MGRLPRLDPLLLLLLLLRARFAAAGIAAFRRSTY
eukprot:gene11319-5518_t